MNIQYNNDILLCKFQCGYHEVHTVKIVKKRVYQPYEHLTSVRPELELKQLI